MYENGSGNMKKTQSSSIIKSLKWRIGLMLQINKVCIDLMQSSPLNYLRYMRKCYYLFSKHGFLPDEARRLGLLNFKGNAEEYYVSKSRMVAQQRILNPPSFHDLTEDKAIFYSYCERINIPIPKLLGLLFKHSTGMNWRDRQPLFGNDQWADFFVNHCPAEFATAIYRLNEFSVNKKLIEKTLQWTINNMQDKQGYFYYQINMGIPTKIPYMRWGQAWMMYGISFYLLGLKENNDDRKT